MCYESSVHPVEQMRDVLFRFSYRRGPRLMSELRKWWVVFRHPRATIEFGEHTYVGPGFSLHIPDRGTFIAGAGSEFRRGFRCEIHGRGRVAIGKHCVFTSYPLIQCTTSIEFGDRVMVGQSAQFADGNHRWRDPDRPLNEQGYDFEEIEIGDDVVIFSKVTVTSSIGRKSLVAANAVVAKRVESYVLVGGVPARVIERLERPASERPSVPESA